MATEQVERMAAEVVALPAGLTVEAYHARIGAILGDDVTIAMAVMDLAGKIILERTAATARQAETLVAIGRLSRLCPDGTDDPVQWLLDLGLIENDGAGRYKLTARASLRIVGKDS
jgi:hypothetical protein